jgi:hypothetical protein
MRMVTDAEHIYPAWRPSRGVHSEEFKPVKSTALEIKRLGGASIFEEIFPDEAAMGFFVFYIPDQESAKALLLHDLDTRFEIEDPRPKG